MGSRAVFGACGALALALAASCTLTTSLDGLTSGTNGAGLEGGTPDGTLPEGAPIGEGGPGSTGTVTIAPAGDAPRSTGSPMQGHVLFAERSSRWVAFAFDGASRRKISTRTSIDFLTWTDGPSIDLPIDHDKDGRNLAVATAAVGDRDVLHLSVSLPDSDSDRRHYWVRGTIAGTALTFSPATQVTQTAVREDRLAPDGAAVGIANDAFVTLFTGWSQGLSPSEPNDGTGNEYAFRSSGADVGADFTTTWQKAYLKTVPTICNARGALAIGSSDLLAFFEKGDEDPRPTNLSWTRGTTNWSPPADVFEARRSFDAGDWSAARLSDADVHAVRLRQDGVVDHRRWNGSSWQDGAAIPSESLSTGAGLALVKGSTPGSLVLFAVAGGSAIRQTTWNGTAWSAWTTRIAAGPSRSALVATDSATRAAIAWTESGSSGFVVAGAVVR